MALAALASHLDETSRPSVVREALEAARGIGDDWTRAMALAALAPHLDGSARPSVVREALEAVRGIGDDWARATALAVLASFLEYEEKQGALVLLRS